MKQKIAIVGAGPVGILMAVGLANLGFEVELIERRSRTDLLKRTDRTKLSRLYAISLGSFEIMRDVVGINFNTSNFQPINKIFINDGNASTIFNPIEIDEKIFGYMVEESDLFSQLIEALDVLGGKIKVRYGVSSMEIVEEEGLKGYSSPQMFHVKHSDAMLKGMHSYSNSNVGIKIDNSFLDADLILAADGRNSAFRKKFPFGEKHKNYKELALVFAIKHNEFMHDGLAVETFFPSGPFAVLPHAASNSSSIVWSANYSLIEAFLEFEHSEQHSLIAEKLPDFYGEFSFDSELITYPLHLITLDELYYKNVVLLGDSSHVVHPVAGQGFNLGIRDVRDLLHVLKQYNFYTDTEHMLEEYGKLRKSDISKLANSTDFLSDLFSNNNIFLKGVRRLGLDLFDCLPKKNSKIRSNTIRYAAGKG